MGGKDFGRRGRNCVIDMITSTHTTTKNLSVVALMTTINYKCTWYDLILRKSSQNYIIFWKEEEKK